MCSCHNVLLVCCCVVCPSSIRTHTALPHTICGRLVAFTSAILPMPIRDVFHMFTPSFLNQYTAGVTPQLTVQGGMARAAVNVVRKTDDVNTFLQTVDLAGVPQGTHTVLWFVFLH